MERQKKSGFAVLAKSISLFLTLLWCLMKWEKEQHFLHPYLQPIF